MSKTITITGNLNENATFVSDYFERLNFSTVVLDLQLNEGIELYIQQSNTKIDALNINQPIEPSKPILLSNNFFRIILVNTSVASFSLDLLIHLSQQNLTGSISIDNIVSTIISNTTPILTTIDELHTTAFGELKCSISNFPTTQAFPTSININNTTPIPTIGTSMVITVGDPLEGDGESTTRTDNLHTTIDGDLKCNITNFPTTQAFPTSINVNNTTPIPTTISNTTPIPTTINNTTPIPTTISNTTPIPTTINNTIPIPTTIDEQHTTATGDLKCKITNFPTPPAFPEQISKFTFTNPENHLLIKDERDVITNKDLEQIHGNIKAVVPIMIKKTVTANNEIVNTQQSMLCDPNNSLFVSDPLSRFYLSAMQYKIDQLNFTSAGSNSNLRVEVTNLSGSSIPVKIENTSIQTHVSNQITGYATDEKIETLKTLLNHELIPIKNAVQALDFHYFEAEYKHNLRFLRSQLRCFRFATYFNIVNNSVQNSLLNPVGNTKDVYLHKMSISCFRSPIPDTIGACFLRKITAFATNVGGTCLNSDFDGESSTARVVGGNIQHLNLGNIMGIGLDSSGTSTHIETFEEYIRIPPGYGVALWMEGVLNAHQGSVSYAWHEEDNTPPPVNTPPVVLPYDDEECIGGVCLPVE